MTKYILGGVIALGLTFFCASSNEQAKEKKMTEAPTINGEPGRLFTLIRHLSNELPSL
jgi:hypothetical protein